MEILGSLFLIFSLAIAVALFVGRPFFNRELAQSDELTSAADSLEHQRSSLLAERDRVLMALQELEFDDTLGKIPAEDYPLQREELLRKGAFVLRELDRMQPETNSAVSAEDRIEAAVASRRADAVQHQAGAQPEMQPVAVAVAEKSGAASKDGMEDLIAARRRQRQEKASGFCPKCGRPALKSDKFCSKCGATL
jgi:hypothetical protein